MEKVNRDTINRLLLRTILLTTTCAPFVGLPPLVHAFDDSPAIKSLLARAQALAAHGHLDIAVQTWQQVLLSDPTNREALGGISKADMQLGKTEEAKSYLNRLRNLGGDGKDVAAIESMPAVQSQDVRLAQASRLARAGNYAGSMKIYRDIFGDQPPAGNWALAYYDTEAATPETRPHAIEGLRRLSQQFPADSRYAITLGRILTYDPKTRAEGVAVLSRYSDSREAQTSLQQVQKWNGDAQAAQAAQKPAAGQTLQATGGREAEPAAAPAAPAGDPHLGAGYKALNAGRLDDADREFRTALDKAPHDPQALSGLGYVRMKQHNFADAADYLGRAQQAGATGRGLDDALSLSRFWQGMGKAADEQKAGNTTAALEDYRHAQQLRPASPEAAEGVAGVLMQTGSTTEAADIYSRELHTTPSRAAAWRGLVIAQAQTGDAQGAITTSERVPRELRASLESDPSYLAALAHASLATGHKAESDRVIAKALALPFPNHGRDLPVDQQMQYAELLMAAQRYEPALALYRQVVAEDPENPGAWRALIAAQHQLKQDNEALATLGRMPNTALEASKNNADFLALLGSVYQNLNEPERAQQYLERAVAAGGSSQSGTALQLASVYASRGEMQKAGAIYTRELDRNPNNKDAWNGLLNSLHAAHRDHEAAAKLASIPDDVRMRLEQDPGYLQVAASIEAANGQPKLALRTFDRLAQVYQDQQTPEPVDAQIQYGWLMLRAGDDARLYPLVQTLASTPDMSATEQANFNAMWAAWTMRRADRMYVSGDHAHAMQLLETAHQTFPDNADVANSLAGAYLRSGDSKKAVAVYSTLDMSNATLAQYRGAIGAALAANDGRDAEPWLETALDHYKDDAGLLKLAAQYEQSRGDQRKAAAYYRAALEAMQSDPSSNRLPGSPLGVPGEAGGATPADELMRLLAPSTRASRSGGNGLQNEDPGSDPQSAAPPVRPTSRLRREDQTLGDYVQPSRQLSRSLDPSDGEDGAPREQYAERDLPAPRSYQQPEQDTDQYAQAEPVEHAPRRQSRRVASTYDDTPDARANGANQALLEDDMSAGNNSGSDTAARPYTPTYTGGGNSSVPRLTRAPRSSHPQQALAALPTLDRSGSRDRVSRAEDTLLGNDTAEQQAGSAAPAQTADVPDSFEPVELTPAAARAAELAQQREAQQNAEPAQTADAEPTGSYTQSPSVLLSAPNAAQKPARYSAEQDADTNPANRLQNAVRVLDTGRSTAFETVAQTQDQSASQNPPAGENPGYVSGTSQPLTSHKTTHHTAAHAAKQHTLQRANAQDTLAGETLGQDAGGQRYRAPATRITPQTLATQADRMADPDSPSTSIGGGYTAGNSLVASNEAGAPYTHTLPPLRGSMVETVRPKTPRQEVEDQLALIESSGSNWLGGASSVDYRSGTPGFDRLATYSAQVESSSMLGPGIRATVITRPVLLDGGTASATTTTTLRQGTLPATTAPYVQSASGVGGELQIRTAYFAASAGYTPAGFLVSNVTGSVVIHPPSSHVTISLARDAIQDTQLSYAGLRDEGSATTLFPGNIWGGVISTGGELQVAAGDATQGWYIQGGGQFINGVHVPDNKRIDGDAGAYWAVWHDPAYGSLTIGTNFFGMHYDNNQRFFTYGQGGYFSPSAYLLGSVPVSFTGHYGRRFHYHVAGSLGVQAFSEDSSAYFPLDVATQVAQGNLYYPESTNVGPNYNFESQAAYAMTDHWYVGGYLNANNSRDYVSTKGGFYIRYLFRPQPAMAESGPTGIFPMQGLRPMRVP